jgi:D-xylose 1-dehydrogenase (NADP+, D-xylono-1,5-lactone-forming)
VCDAATHHEPSRGLHVVCEKPLASTETLAREMRDRAVAAGVVHMVMFTYRWMAYYRYVHDLVRTVGRSDARGSALG